MRTILPRAAASRAANAPQGPRATARLPAPGWATVAPMDIEVVRSVRRRKTVQGRVVDGVLRVMIPAEASAAEEAAYVEDLRARFERRVAAGHVDLPARAAALGRRYDLPAAGSVRWVSNQRTRWASCSPAAGDIRVSDRIAGFPPWVLDAVLVHELAHLVHPGHGPAWRALVARYPMMERATGFLIAMGLTADGADD